jgi:hypothetical protein
LTPKIDIEVTKLSVSLLSMTVGHTAWRIVFCFLHTEYSV